MGDSYPYDWIQNSRRRRKTRFNLCSAGHGTYAWQTPLRLWKTHQDLWTKTGVRAYAQWCDLSSQAQKSVSRLPTKKYAPQFDPNFPKSVHR